MKKVFVTCAVLTVCLFLVIGINFEKRINGNVVKASSSNIADEVYTDELQKAFRAVMYSYYMRGSNIQVNTMKTAFFTPEEATPQNINYLVCSGFAKNVYNELLNIKIPPYTENLLQYSRDRVGYPEVIAYGSRDSNNDLTMKFYNSGTQNKYTLLINPLLKDIIPYLRCGDILTYTGHTVLVYDMVYNNLGEPVDAYIMQTGFRFGKSYAVTKISRPVTINNKIKFGSQNHYLFYNKPNKSYTRNKIGHEGSLNIKKLSEQKGWASIGTELQKSEYSILRFVQQDEKGGLKLFYQGSDYDDSNHDCEIIRLANKIKDRIRFDRICLYKTVDIHTNSIVEENDKLSYNIIISNNSNQDYKDNIRVKENISDYVSYEGFTSNKSGIMFTNDILNGKSLIWDIGKLKSGETVKICYTVIVKNNCCGKDIISRGMVENIPLATIKNRIGNNLNKNQVKAIKEKFEILKNYYTGKQLINEIYRQALNIDLKFDSFAITDLIVNADYESKNGDTIFLNNENRFRNTVLSNYWSSLSTKNYNYLKNENVTSYDLKTWQNRSKSDRRADTIYSENFKTGDILVYKNSNDLLYNYKNNILTKIPVTYENGEYAFIYVEGKGFVGINHGIDGQQGTLDDRNEFSAQYYIDNNLNLYSDINEFDKQVLEFVNYQTLFGKDYYVILRPSLDF